MKKKNVSAMGIRDCVLTEGTSFHVQEAYKAMRTNLMFSLPGNGCKKIVVTSSFAGEGKSITCTNLAIAFVQAGYRVLVIDGDLRKPKLHRYMDVQNDIGLAHILGGFNEAKEGIHCTAYEKLQVIPSGHIPPNPAELLASTSMKDLLAKLEEFYDYIFIDTPPINLVTDGVVLGPITSGTIMVVREGQTHHKDLQTSLNKLQFAETKVLGLVLNDMKRMQGGYKKYKGYKYGESYGYSVSVIGNESLTS